MFAFVGLVVSAKTKLMAVIAGQPVTIPVLWLVLAVLVLLLAAVVLCCCACSSVTASACDP